jgi:hypothetical protein
VAFDKLVLKWLSLSLEEPIVDKLKWYPGMIYDGISAGF